MARLLLPKALTDLGMMSSHWNSAIDLEQGTHKESEIASMIIGDLTVKVEPNFLRGFMVVAFASAFSIFSSTSMAIVIDWNVDLTIDGPRESTASSTGIGEEASVSQIRGEIDVPGAYAKVGLSFDLASKPTYRVSLPFRFEITGPSQVTPGQLVPLNVTYGLRSGAAPRLEALTEFDFGTTLSLQTDGRLLPDSNNILSLPDSVSVNGVKATLGGTDFDSTSTNTVASSGAVGTPFDNDTAAIRSLFNNASLSGQVIDHKALNPATGQVSSVPISGASRFEGLVIETPLENDSQVDGWSAGFDVTSLLNAIGPAGAAIDAAVDVNLNAAIDPKEKATLSTGLLAASYSDFVINSSGIDYLSGASSLFTDDYDYLIFNDTRFAPSILVPESVNAGDTYVISFGTLVSTFNILSELFLEPEASANIELNLPAVDDPSLTLFNTSIGDLWEAASEYSSFYFQQFLNDFICGGAVSGCDDLFALNLAFNVVDGLSSSDTARDLLIDDIPSNDLLPSVAGPTAFSNRSVPVDQPVFTSQLSLVSSSSPLALIFIGLLGAASICCRRRARRQQRHFWLSN